MSDDLRKMDIGALLRDLKDAEDRAVHLRMEILARMEGRLGQRMPPMPLGETIVRKIFKVEPLKDGPHCWYIITTDEADNAYLGYDGPYWTPGACDEAAKRARDTPGVDQVEIIEVPASPDKE